mgnify:CR=1 FL=1
MCGDGYINIRAGTYCSFCIAYIYILDFVGGGNRIEVAIPGPVPVPAVKARPSVESDMDASVSKSASSPRKSFPETWLWDLSYR